MGRRKGLKMHYHYIIAFKISENRTRKGNPEHYHFTLDCGHRQYEFHNTRTSLLTFMLAVMIPSMARNGEEIMKKHLPRIHCRECELGKPHTNDATDVDKLLEKINKEIRDANVKTK